jgi:hypothetical protein
MSPLLIAKFEITITLSTEAEERDQFNRNLCATHLKHLHKTRMNVAKKVEELLLLSSNPVQNPHHAWALVRLHC